jgi:hypothetical protein
MIEQQTDSSVPMPCGFVVNRRRGGLCSRLTSNLMVSSNCEPRVSAQSAPKLLQVPRNYRLRDKQMKEGEHRRSGSISLIAAAIVAVIGQAAILLNDFGPGNDSQGNGSARIITAAEVSKAGAIEIPSEPREEQPVFLTP